jgi:hypothetical protein
VRIALWADLLHATSEIEETLRRATTIKRLLEKGLRCDCVSVQDCILNDCNPPVGIGRRKTTEGVVR